MTRLLGGAALAMAVAAAVAMPLRAESPMTPLHSFAAPAAKAPFVEPPPSIEPATPANAASAEPAAASEPQPERPQASRSAQPHRTYRRAAGRGNSSAQQLNRAELRRIGSGVPSYPVYPAYPSGFGPRVYSEGD